MSPLSYTDLREQATVPYELPHELLSTVSRAIWTAAVDLRHGRANK